LNTLQEYTPLSHLAGSVAQAGGLASTLPLAVGGNAMRVVRAGLTVALVPLLLAADRDRFTGPLITELLRGVIIGASLGLGAVIVFGAVVGAGSIIDSAFMWAPVADRAGGGSPVGFLYQAAFAAVLFASGGFSAIVGAAAHGSAQIPLHLASLSGIIMLGKVCLSDGVALAAPALFAQFLASLIAGFAARAAPQVGNILMSAPLIWSAVALVLIASSSLLFGRFADLIGELLACYSQ
jgi:type III secretory pathway component EscT